MTSTLYTQHYTMKDHYMYCDRDGYATSCASTARYNQFLVQRDSQLWSIDFSGTSGITASGLIGAQTTFGNSSNNTLQFNGEIKISRKNENVNGTTYYAIRIESLGTGNASTNIWTIYGHRPLDDVYYD